MPPSRAGSGAAKPRPGGRKARRPKVIVKNRKRFVLKAVIDMAAVNRALQMRPSVHYTPEVAEKICTLVAAGMSFATISQLEGFPSVRGIINWLGIHKEFAQAYDDASEARAHYYAEHLRLVTKGLDDQLIDPETGRTGIDAGHMAVARLESDNLRWLMSKLYPLKYGDISQHRMAGHDGGPLPLTIPRTISNIVEALSDEQLDQLKQIVDLAEQSADEPASADVEEDSAPGEGGTPTD